MKEYIKINALINDWKRAKNHCRTTVNKEFTDKDPSEVFKKKLSISEHSPVRCIEIDFSLKDIPYWVSTELSRHKFEKFITSQRNDRQSDYDRNKAPQDSPVDFDALANEQNLIDFSRKRLCFKASPEACNIASDLKLSINEIDANMAFPLVPNCIYRCGCPEFESCGFFNWFMRYFKEHGYDIFDIEERYRVYNEYFYENKKY